MKSGTIMAEKWQNATIGAKARRGAGSVSVPAEARGRTVVARYLGALVRAILVVLVIALPSIILPSVNADTGQVVTLVALFAAALTFFEYASVYPGLVEFRDAPPFNRIRYGSLFVMVGMLSVVELARYEPSTLARLIDVLGAAMARTLDLPYSPVRLLVLMLPADAAPAQVALLRTAGGVAFMTALLTLGYFVLVTRAIGWPMGGSRFNVWVNLPTFDPTAGGDVVERLRRDAWFNIALGVLLPFLVPAVVKLVSSGLAPVSFESPQTLIWMVAAWAFLPTSLLMRGVAMSRVADMIEEKRRAANGPEFLPV